MLWEKSREIPQKMKQKRNKKAEKRDCAQGWGTTRPVVLRAFGRAWWDGCATQHGLAMPLLWPAGRAGSWGHGPCALFFARVFACFARVIRCFALFCFPWSSGLPRTSNLSWNCSWSLLFYQHLMISPETKSECVFGTIRSKRGQSDPNSTRFNIKRMRNNGSNKS